MMKLRDEKGFTLIELLVVVAIIGILVAIAIPQFAAYKKQGKDAAASSDLRNMAVSQEAYYVSNSSYATGTLSTTLGSYGYKQSTGTVVAITGTPTATHFVATAYHTGGSKTYTWDSAQGGLQ